MRTQGLLPKRQTNLVSHVKDYLVGLGQNFRSQWWKLSTRVERNTGIAVSSTRLVQILAGFLIIAVPLAIKYFDKPDLRPEIRWMLLVLAIAYFVNLSISLFRDIRLIKRRGHHENLRHVTFCEVVKSIEFRGSEEIKNRIIRDLLDNVRNLAHIYICAKEVDNVRACLIRKDGTNANIIHRDSHSSATNPNPTTYSFDPHSRNPPPLLPVVIDAFHNGVPCFDPYVTRSMFNLDHQEVRDAYMAIARSKVYESILVIPFKKNAAGEVETALSIDATKPTHDWDDTMRNLGPYTTMLEKVLDGRV